jgi:hypothetical protein
MIISYVSYVAQTCLNIKRMWDTQHFLSQIWNASVDDEVHVNLFSIFLAGSVSGRAFQQPKAVKLETKKEITGLLCSGVVWDFKLQVAWSPAGDKWRSWKRLQISEHQKVSLLLLEPTTSYCQVWPRTVQLRFLVSPLPKTAHTLATLCKSSRARNSASFASNPAISASISSWRCCARMIGSKRKGHREWPK